MTNNTENTTPTPKAGTADHPELANMKKRLFDITQRGEGLTTEQKYLVLIAIMATQGFASQAQKTMAEALKAGVSATALRESILQVIPVVGLQPVEAILPSVVEAMKEGGVKFPMEQQATVTDENRLQKGTEVWAGIFGDKVLELIKSVPDDEKCILVGDIAGWCFGDFYTRGGLSLKDRELVVFASIAAMGGFPADLEGHAKAGLKLGNTKQMLIGAIHLAVPLIGIPKTRQALSVVQSLE